MAISTSASGAEAPGSKRDHDVRAVTAVGSAGRSDRLVHVAGVQHCAHAVAELGIEAPRPVIVVIGGAGKMPRGVAREIGDLLDRGVVGVAGATGAVLVTGGTCAGVMERLGELVAARSNIDLVGVAPAALVRHGSVQDGAAGDGSRESGSTTHDAGSHTLFPLDPHHHLFVLSPGETWGSETEVLVGVAAAIRGERAGGVVLLANGGAVAQHEAKRFMSSGWPVITLAGTDRAADSLAKAVRQRRSRRVEWREVVGLPRGSRSGWGDLSGFAVEIHDARPKRDPVELLARRVAWHLTDRLVLRQAWSRFGSFERAATRSKASSRRFQLGLAAGALLLSALSVVYGTVEGLDRVQAALVVLPLLLAVASSLGDTIAPARNWLMMRQAAESVRQAIYRTEGGVHAGHDPDEALAGSLEAVDRSLVDSGTPLGFIGDVEGRPASLSPATDEFAPLTPSRYVTERVDGQLRYYKRTARLMRRREHLSIAVTALLAGTATFIASQITVAPWMPFVVLVASTLVILRQRARWEDKVTLCSVAIAGIESARLSALLAPEGDARKALGALVESVEDVIEGEIAAWSQTMRRAHLDSYRFRHPHADGRFS